MHDIKQTLWVNSTMLIVEMQVKLIWSCMPLRCGLGRLDHMCHQDVLWVDLTLYVIEAVSVIKLYFGSIYMCMLLRCVLGQFYYKYHYDTFWATFTTRVIETCFRLIRLSVLLRCALCLFESKGTDDTLREKLS